MPLLPAIKSGCLWGCLVVLVISKMGPEWSKKNVLTEFTPGSSRQLVSLKWLSQAALGGEGVTFPFVCLVFCTSAFLPDAWHIFIILQQSAGR